MRAERLDLLVHGARRDRDVAVTPPGRETDRREGRAVPQVRPGRLAQARLAQVRRDPQDALVELRARAAEAPQVARERLLVLERKVEALDRDEVVDRKAARRALVV